MVEEVHKNGMAVVQVWIHSLERKEIVNSKVLDTTQQGNFHISIVVEHHFLKVVDHISEGSLLEEEVANRRVHFDQELVRKLKVLEKVVDLSKVDVKEVLLLVQVPEHD